MPAEKRAARKRPPAETEARSALTRFIFESWVIRVFISFADAGGVNQRSASNSCSFRPKRSKKASHYVKGSGLPEGLSEASLRPYMPVALPFGDLHDIPRLKAV